MQHHIQLIIVSFKNFLVNIQRNGLYCEMSHVSLLSLFALLVLCTPLAGPLLSKIVAPFCFHNTHTP